MNSLTKFYKKKKHVDSITKILQGNTKLSLRIIDWFVTNYSKKNNVIYDINKKKKSTSVKEQFLSTSKL